MKKTLYLSIGLLIGLVSSQHYLENQKYNDISFLVQFIEARDKDSKSFVDKLLKKGFDEIARDFDMLITKNNIDINKLKSDFLENDKEPQDNVTTKFKNQLKFFVNKNFTDDNTNFPSSNVSITKPGWILDLDSDLKHIADRILKLWTIYGRISGQIDSERTTKIKLNSKFFIPGGRFKELYYWDSLWILIGLLESDMEEGAFEIVKCFVELINKFGYIPNGTRLYYIGRSQPPVFCQMLDRLYSNTKNQEIKNYILTEGLKAAEIEYDFFMTKRRIPDPRFENEILNMYIVDAKTPRFESYKEDLRTHKDNPNVSAEYIYSNLWAGAESGWDFSSRWFEDGKTLSKIAITNIIPVDLNAFMLENERILIKLNMNRLNQLDKTDISLRTKIETLTSNREKRWKAMNTILFNTKIGCWNDYNYARDKHTSNRFYFSNIIPLFYSDDFNLSDSEILKILKLYEKPLFGHVGGVPCSGEPKTKVQDPQQWDYPNVWPLHVQMLVEFLQRKGFDNMAYHVARSFFNSVKAATQNDKIVFLEKYDCNTIGKKGEGGEYNTQQGFGWTNGTTMFILRSYGNRLNSYFNHSKSFELIQKEIGGNQVLNESNEFQGKVGVPNEEVLITYKQ